MTEDLTDVQKKNDLLKRKKSKKDEGKKSKHLKSETLLGGKRRGKIMDTGYKSVFNVEMCV